jgi:hypothetical protein
MATKLTVLLILLLQMTLSRIKVSDLMKNTKDKNVVKLKNYIRQLSLKNQQKHKVKARAIENPEAIAKRIKFEKMRDFLSRNKGLDYKNKLKIANANYKQKLELASKHLKSDPRMLTKIKALQQKTIGKNRKLEDEPLTKDSLTDDVTKYGVESVQDAEQMEKHMHHIKTARNYLYNLETDLDGMRTAINKKMLELANGLQRRKMMLGHFNGDGSNEGESKAASKESVQARKNI